MGNYIKTIDLHVTHRERNSRLFLTERVVDVAHRIHQITDDRQLTDVHPKQHRLYVTGTSGHLARFKRLLKEHFNLFS